MPFRINIDNLSEVELVQLREQINGKISEAQGHTMSSSNSNNSTEITLRSEHLNNSISNNNGNGHLVASNGDTCIQVMKKPLQRMSCPPPPPPVKESHVNSMETINPILNRSYSTESTADHPKPLPRHNNAIPITKPRTKLQLSASKPPIAPKPKILTYKMYLPSNSEVIPENIILAGKLAEEFTRLRMDGRKFDTIKREKPKLTNLDEIGNSNISSNIMANVKKVGTPPNKLTVDNSIRPLPEIPPSLIRLPPTPKPRQHIIQPSGSNMITERLSSIYSKTIENLNEKAIPVSEANYSKEYNDEEPIYESIAESVYNPIENNLSIDYEESIVFNTLRRDKRDRYAATAPIHREGSPPPPPLPPKSGLLLQRTNIPKLHRSDGETESETSSIYSENARAYGLSHVYGDRESVYLPSYPPCEESISFEYTIRQDMTRKYKEAIDRINQSERMYVEQLENIFSIYTENIGKVDVNHLNGLFGDIKGLMDFHKDFYLKCRYSQSLPQLGKLIIKMENGFNIYIRDQWCKSTKITLGIEHGSIFMPYRNWAENHLSMYEHLLNQLHNDEPDIKVASTIISELIRQCASIQWLKEITNFPKIQEAGKFLLKDSFRVKVNSMDRGYCDIIFMEKYILCISPQSKECFCHFNTTKISMAKKGPKSLFIENIFKEKKVRLKSNDPNIIETWYNRYLHMVHKKSDCS